MPAERAGQGEVGGCTRRVQTAWPCLGSALNSPWLEPSRPFLGCISINGPRKQWSHLAEPRIPVFKADFSARASYRRPSILIAYKLTSGCGQNHEWGKHGCVQFCVKF